MGVILALLLSVGAQAETAVVGAGPRRRPLFVQIYRQSVYAALRYRIGAEAYDADLAPGATAALNVRFNDHGPLMRITLGEGDREFASGVAEFPSERWDALAEVGKARAFAAGLVKRIPASGAPPARIATDLARAQLAYGAFNLPSMVWLTNVLGEAQRGRPGSAEALRLMSAAHAWTGRWLNGMPTHRAKLFQARALAYAALAQDLSGSAEPELALALAHCGRQADALLVLSRSTPDASEIAGVAEALARHDMASARARATQSRQWRWTQVLTPDHPPMEEESQAALRVLVSSDTADFPALRSWAVGADVSEGHAATGRYLASPFRLLKGGDFLAGRRVRLEDGGDADNPLDFKAFVEGLAQAGPGDPAEEIPRGARAALLLDTLVNATLLTQEFMVHRLGTPQDSERLAVEAAPIVAAHPWGFAIPLLRDDLAQSREAPVALQAGLASAPVSVGAASLVRRNFKTVDGFNERDWAASRWGEFDDVAFDVKWRSYGTDFREGLERLAELDPYETAPFERNERGLLDAGLAKLGDRPSLLRLKLRLALVERPRDAGNILSIADRLLSVAPVDQDALNAKSSLLVYAGKPVEGAEAWREFVRRKPGSLAAAQAVASMAWAYSVAGRFRHARRLALAAAPAYSYVNLSTLAQAYENTGRYDLAEQVYAAVEARYEVASRRNLRGKFYMRTGDPRGYGLVHAGIPRFFDYQQHARGGGILTEEDHALLLQAFLMVEEWGHAFHLLDTVLVPRWGEGKASYLLWAIVTGLKSGQLDSAGVRQFLEGHAQRFRPEEPLVSVIEAFLHGKDPDTAVADLDLDPDYRVIGMYMLAQYWIHVRPNPANATALLEAAVALRRHETTSHYLALKALGRIPSYPVRLGRQVIGILNDMGAAPGRLDRLRKKHGSGR